MGKLLCCVLDNWEKGDAIGEEETAASCSLRTYGTGNLLIKL